MQERIGLILMAGMILGLRFIVEYIKETIKKNKNKNKKNKSYI